MKFKYNHLTNQLTKIDPHNPEYSYQLTQENQFPTNFGGLGFYLGSGSWITFTTYEKKIRVFYKKVVNNETFYYRQDFFKTDSIGFEFTPSDQVIKNEKGHWVKKE